MLPQILVKNFFQKFLALEASDPSLFLSPAAAHSARPTQNCRKLCFLRIFFKFFGFQNVVRNLLPKNMQKNAKIKDFGLPKWTQNPCFFAYFWETSIFQKSCSRRGGNSIFEVLSLPKRRPNPSKIDVKNVLFFNIDFLRFWLRFWKVLGFQLGAKLVQKASKSELEAPLGMILS